MIKRLALAAVFLAAFTGNAMAGKTLDTIKQRGQLVCGVNPSLPGFSAADSQGNWTGLDVDICKAIAASILSDDKKIKWVPLNASQRFTALLNALGKSTADCNSMILAPAAAELVIKRSAAALSSSICT